MRTTVFVILALALNPFLAFGANDKIDPKTYICAEFVASTVNGEPPLFESLQLDGYYAGSTNQTAADPANFKNIILAVYDSCTPEPAEKAIDHWREARKHWPLPIESQWQAEKTTCADYAANQDDGSGFVIWLDGWQRAKNNTSKSVFADQKTLDECLGICAKNPQKTMLEVFGQCAR